MYIELTGDTLQQIIQENDKVMVQYGATWCGNCRIMKPKFKKLAAENEDIPFYYVDAEKFPESRKLATVDNLPTFALPLGLITISTIWKLHSGKMDSSKIFK